MIYAKMQFNAQPHLESDLVHIRPIANEDFDELFEVASDPLIWQQHQNANRYLREEFILFFNDALGSKSAFAILDKNSKRLIGSSRFRMIDANKEVVEIGWSFLAKAFWGGVYNRDIKKLMVNYALKFCKLVVFYVNLKNLRSQSALEKLGATKIDDFSKSWVLPAQKGVTFMIDSLIS